MSANKCSESPCQNGATCLDSHGDGMYLCQCMPGYTGTNCDIEFGPCDGVLCLNGSF